MEKERKIFFVMAGGGHGTDKHYFDTIKNKRTVDEAKGYLSSAETEQLAQAVHSQPFAAWGAVPGPGNKRTWESMDPGDYVLVYRERKIILAAEIGAKIRSKALAKHYWGMDGTDQTWELMYFLINDFEINVRQTELNKYLGYEEGYHPQGFMAIRQEKVNALLSHYGDLLSFLHRIEAGQKPEEIDIDRQRVIEKVIDEQVEKAPTDHTEMQWRLIRLGQKSHFDVWVPKNDQGRAYDGNTFRDHVLKEFHETLDVPTYVQNIDTVWKFGYSIKSAFEIENSTSIYSGILRLSDLRSLAPNSSYPLFIVAQREKKHRVFEQLRRPTFASEYLQLDRAVKFLSYDAIRELDNDLKGERVGFDLAWLMERAESVA